MTDTEPCHPIDPAHQFPRDIYLMVVDLLRRALPDPAEDTPEAWALRHRVAMGEVAALLPAGGAEAHVAANHVVANWAASECMCAAAAQKDNPKRADQLQNQSAKLGREARGYHNTLLRMQKERMRREKTEEGAVRSDRHEASVLGLMTDALATLPPGRPVRAAAAAPVAEAAPAPAKRVFIDYDDLPEEVKANDRRKARASRFCVVDTMRAQEIRKCGGLPPGANYEIEPELLHDIIHGVGGNFEWADTYVPWVAPEGYVPPKD